MADKELYRNGEGYADPTAGEALDGLAKTGEVWAYGLMDKQALIIKNHGNFCTALTLAEYPYNSESVEVQTREGVRFTNPAMVRYIWTDKLRYFVSRLPDAEWDEMRERIAQVLDVIIPSRMEADSKKLAKVTAWVQGLQKGAGRNGS